MKYSIAFLIHDISNGGGTERVTTVLANELIKNNYSVTIISCKKGDSSYFDLNKNVKILSLHGEKIQNAFLRRLKGVKQLRTFQRKLQFQYFICVDIALMPYAIFLNRSKVKIIAWEHFNFYVKVGSRLMNFSRNLAAKYADAIIVITKEDFYNYQNYFKKMKIIKQIYNPVVVNKNYELNGKHDNIVLAVGRLSSEKGFDLLLNAWRQIEDQYSEWKLRIVGSGDEYDKLISLTKGLGLKNVEYKPHTKLIEKEYRQAKIFVCSSRFEGFGLVLVEAQMCGLPVVSFDCPVGPKEIIKDKYNGLLVPQQDIDALSKALKELISNKKLRHQLISNLENATNKYNVKEVCKQWINLFNELRG